MSKWFIEAIEEWRVAGVWDVGAYQTACTGAPRPQRPAPGRTPPRPSPDARCPAGPAQPPGVRGTTMQQPPH